MQLKRRHGWKAIPPRIAARAGRSLAGYSARKNLPDGTEVIGGVSGRGERGGSAHGVPSLTCGHNLPPLFGLLAEIVAQRSPLFFGNCCALPTGVPVGAGPRIRLARRPAVQH